MNESLIFHKSYGKDEISGAKELDVIIRKALMSEEFKLEYNIT